MTRSWVYLLHGRWHDAVWSNAFGPVALVAALLVMVVVVRARLAGRRPPDLDRLARHPAVLTVVALWLTYAGVRLVLAA